ncbi:hypothetical protein CVT24_011340 [Panaeolus cyanescens]|uniref:Prenylcysteine lyase domain-containing protein n=1 Tax=Panaeolus cyanescens TaxID=181874 RepID=A0A409WE44_9AGAR|nr:hypothetical protein CVT24_011340 [Panaeolus cyanescens]
MHFFLQKLSLSIALLAILHSARLFDILPALNYISGRQLSVNDPQTTGLPFNVAIIGAGAGGSSSAFWISKAMNRSDLNISIDIFEQSSYIGGRSFSVNQTVHSVFSGQISVELGAHLFEDGHRNMWRAASEFNLPVDVAQIQSIYTWNGLKLQHFCTSFNCFVDYLWNYGYRLLSPGSGDRSARRVAAKFAEFYHANFTMWDRHGQLIDRLGLLTLLTSKSLDHFLEVGTPRLLVDDLFLPLLGYTHSPTHALQSVFQMTPHPHYQIPGGTRRVFEEFIQASSASVMLNTTVKSIEKSADARRWRVNTANTSGEYDAVIIAAPFHQTNMTSPEEVSAQVPLVSYETVHVTVVVTRSPYVNTTFPASQSQDEDMSDVMMGKEDKRRGDFSSLTHWRYAGQVWVVTIKSRSSLSDDWLSRAFAHDVEHVYRQKWEHPVQAPTVDFSPIRLEQGLYYLNGFESVVSSMETQIVASLNLVNLLLHDFFKVDVCGPTTREKFQGTNRRHFVAGWDC